MSFFELGADLVLTAGDHTAQLTPIEAGAMRYLLAHAGTVVLRESLEREVWGLHPDVQSEAVPVAIRQLRNKLGPHRELLQTVRAVGWRLCVDEGPLWTVRQLARNLDARAIASFRTDLPMLLASLSDVDISEVEELTAHLVLLADAIVPAEVERIVRAALRRHPGSLVVRLFAARFTADLDAIDEGLAHEDVHLRVQATRVQRRLRPAEVDDGQLEALEAALDGSERLEVAGLRLSRRLAHLDEHALGEVDQLLEQARAYPLLHIDLQLTFGKGLFRFQKPARAVLLFDAAIEGAEALGLDVLLARRLRALVALHLPSPPHTEALLEVAGLLEASGRAQEGAEARGYAALVKAGAGDWPGLADALVGAGGSPSMARIVEVLALVSRVAQGDADARERLCTTTAETFLAVGEHEDFARFLAAWCAELALALAGDVDAWTRIAALPDAPDNTEATLLRRLARSR